MFTSERLLIGSLAAIMLLGWWPWNVLLVFGAGAGWCLYRFHQVRRIKLDAPTRSRVGEIPTGSLQGDPGCWTWRNREPVIDARPARDGRRGSWLREEAGNAIYASNAANGGQRLDHRSMRNTGSNGAASRIECIMSGRPGCICEFAPVNEFLAHFSDVIEERQNIGRSNGSK